MTRQLRTLVQVLVAIATVVPSAVAALEAGGIHLNGAAISAVTGAAVVIVTAVQNALEDAGVLKDRRV